MQTLSYGPSDAQVADLHEPAGGPARRAVVLFHGGSFEAAYGRDMLHAAAEDLARLGVLALNATYRRLGSGGGWPETFDDARAALALLRDRPELEDVTVLGFSAGFPVAVHAVARATPEDRVRRLVGLAGVGLVEQAARANGPSGSIWRLLGDPDAAPEAYAGADPAALIPLGVPSLVVHGDADELVPVGVGEAWVQAARAAGDDATLRPVAGAGHFDVHVPSGEGWNAVVGWLA